MDLYSELFQLVEALAEADVEYALCGGIAVAMYGHPRLTKDIDVLVRPENLDAFLSAAATVGFTVERGRIPFGLATENEQIVYRVSKVSKHDLLALDAILVGPPLEDVWGSRAEVEWQGRVVPIVSLEGLGKMKRRAARRQDLADLENLGLLPESDDDGTTKS